jgi:phosphoglycolate phosphatase
MTTNSPNGAAVDDIIARTRYVLLDFDGPICDIFAGLAATTVADRLRKLIIGQGVTLPAQIASSPDPIEVFTYSATVSADLAAKVEAEMTDQEVEAVATSRPTPYVHDVVTSCQDSRRPIAVVSNNSDRAVRAYLALHGLDDRIELVAARTSSDPGLLKPSPHLIEQAITGLSAPPGECVIVGDSTTDMQAAELVGMDSIGYANKPGKHARLAEAGATAVISSLADLVLSLRARPLPN